MGPHGTHDVFGGCASQCSLLLALGTPLTYASRTTSGKVSVPAPILYRISVLRSLCLHHSSDVSCLAPSCCHSFLVSAIYSLLPRHLLLGACPTYSSVLILLLLARRLFGFLMVARPCLRSSAVLVCLPFYLSYPLTLALSLYLHSSMSASIAGSAKLSGRVNFTRASFF